MTNVLKRSFNEQDMAMVERLILRKFRQIRRVLKRDWRATEGTPFNQNTRPAQLY